MGHHPNDAAWGWHGPRTSLVSVHVEQLYDDDEIHALARRHNIHLAPTIEDALTQGGDELAVDAVLLIGEHGRYPCNEFGQKLYPRKEMFDRIVAVYERCGRCVPLFCDKHLSWNFDWAQQMVATAERMGFNLFAGSSLPHCAFSAPLPSPAQCPPEEVVGVFAQNPESYGYHSIELVQSYVEGRPGGESGVRSVTAYEGEALDEALQRAHWSPELYRAAITAAGAPDAGPPTTAFLVEYLDGLRAVHLNVPSLSGWALGVRSQGDPHPHAARVVLGGHETLHGHFARLARVIEDTIITGEVAYPLERTLLATGVIAAAMRAQQRIGTPLPTPELTVRYSPESDAIRTAE